MNTNTYQGSAKIYQFPARSRMAVAGKRESAAAVPEFISPRISDSAFGDCWYHETAIGQPLGSTKS